MLTRSAALALRRRGGLSVTQRPLHNASAICTGHVTAGATTSDRGADFAPRKTGPPRRGSRCGGGLGLPRAGKASVQQPGKSTPGYESAPPPMGSAAGPFTDCAVAALTRRPGPTPSRPRVIVIERPRIPRSAATPFDRRADRLASREPRQGPRRRSGQAGWPGPWSEPTRCEAGTAVQRFLASCSGPVIRAADQ